MAARTAATLTLTHSDIEAAPFEVAGDELPRCWWLAETRSYLSSLLATQSKAIAEPSLAIIHSTLILL
jgi:hypothetical protein